MPGGVERAGNTVFDRLAIFVLVAHVTFNGRTAPDQLAGHRVAGIDAANGAEFTTGNAGDQLALGNDRSGRSGVASGVVTELFFPDDLAGVLVEGDQLGIERGEEDQIAVQRGATVDHITAGHDAVGQAMLVFPQFLAGFDVDRKDAAVGRGDEHLAVADDRLRFLAALFFAAEGH